MTAHSSDTIVAIATPIGEGGIAVLRVSGLQALSAVARGFRGSTDIESASSHTAHFGKFFSSDNTHLDDVVAVVYRAPNSYTGEETIEVSCHGGLFVTRRILEALLEYGCRHAEPGEFTKRAFLNGKIDLSQAEAVADLIQAKSERSRDASLQQLRGNLSAQIDQLRQDLIRTSGLLELELDFSEDGYELADKKDVKNKVESAISQIDGLIASYQKGRVYRDGVKIVLAGMPNVGKSSLLNALLKQNRAIVTEVPGTTRDTIEESIVIDGVLFRIVDTAGLRETIDRVEAEGVRRSHDQVMTGDVLLLVLDGSQKHQEEELNLARRLVQDLKRESAPVILVINKIDLVREQDGKLDGLPKKLETPNAVKISALTGEGLEDLRKLLVEVAAGSTVGPTDSSVTVTNARHFDSLLRARGRLSLTLESIAARQSGEFLAVDLRGALDSLGEITGAVTTDDILNEIFSKFCVGK
jgi:tRNA modification GTPase